VPIKHTLFWRFLPDVSDSQRTATISELNSLPDHFPQMRGWALGENISERDDTFSHAFSVEFDTIDDLNSYLGSARHEEFVAERWRHLIERRAIVSFEYGSADRSEEAP
jgi:2,3-dihydroxy-p-cumate/2,3-dihydroxybenzoate 3,4-dioxygenase